MQNNLFIIHNIHGIMVQSLFFQLLNLKKNLKKKKIVTKKKSKIISLHRAVLYQPTLIPYIYAKHRGGSHSLSILSTQKHKQRFYQRVRKAKSSKRGKKMSGMGDGYVGTAQDAVRIRKLEKQREAERRKIQELKDKSASSKGQPGLLQFGKSRAEVRLFFFFRVSQFPQFSLFQGFYLLYDTYTIFTSNAIIN